MDKNKTVHTIESFHFDVEVTETKTYFEIGKIRLYKKWLERAFKYKRSDFPAFVAFLQSLTTFSELKLVDPTEYPDNSNDLVLELRTVALGLIKELKLENYSQVCLFNEALVGCLIEDIK